MKKIIFTLFLILCFNTKIFALNGKLGLVINSTPTWPDYWTIYANQTRDLTLNATIGSASTSDIYNYIRINVCSSSDLSNSYSTGSFKDLKVYNTKKECDKSIRPGKGYIQYLQVAVPSWESDGYSYSASGDLYLTNKKGFQEDVVFNNYYGTNYDEVQQLIDNDKIIDNQNNNKNDIINNQNQNTNDIIQNQNQNNDKINNNLQNCRPSKNLFDVNFKSSFASGTHDYILKLKPNTYYTMSSNVPKTRTAMLYFAGGSSGTNGVNITSPRTFKTDSNGNISVFIRGTATDDAFDLWTSLKTSNDYWVMLNEGVSALKYEPFGKEICESKLDGINGGIGDINNSINNSNVDNPQSMFDKFNQNIANNGPITKLVALPITLYQSVLNGVNGACKPFNLGNLLGTNLTMPCIDLKFYLGPVIYHSIDLLISGFAIYKIARHFRQTFDSLSELRGGAIM